MNNKIADTSRHDIAKFKLYNLLRNNKPISIIGTKCDEGCTI